MENSKILAIGLDKKLYTRNDLNSAWVKAPDKGGAVTGVTIMKDGTILAIGLDKKLYTRNNLNSAWVKAPDKGGKVTGVTVMKDGTILAIGLNQKLYTRDNLNSAWVKAPDKGGKVTGVSIMEDGTILAIGLNKKLYTRNDLNSAWVKAPDKGGAVTGISIMEDGAILAIGLNKKLYTRNDLNSAWVKAPDKGGKVTGVTIMGKKSVSQTPTAETPTVSKDSNSVKVTYKKGSKGIKVLGIEGGVFISKPLTEKAKRLWELKNSSTKDHVLTISDQEKNTFVKTGWTITDHQLWAYPKDMDGMVPLHCYYDTQANNHIYTTNSIEKKELDETKHIQYKGLTCSLLPLDLNGKDVSPLLRVHDEISKDTKYVSSVPRMQSVLNEAGKVVQPVLESSTLTIGAALDKAFGAEFGAVGKVIGEVLELFDFKVEKYTYERKQVDPYWSTLLRKKDLVPTAILDGFKKTTDIYTWDTSMKNIANPTHPRIKVQVQLKLFATDLGPGLQLRTKLVGEYCLDDAIPAKLRMNQSIPIIGPFLVKDITFIFATAKAMYDPSLDAGIVQGFNIYANINFDKTDGRERPPIMQAITQVTGVKSCALHLGLGISGISLWKMPNPKIGLIAEMALQWRQYNIAPTLGVPKSALSNTSTNDVTTPPTGFAFPSIETDYFAVRFTRSDFSITGELSTEGAKVELGISSDLAVEINNLEDYFNIPDTRLVFTGGVSIGGSLETTDTPEVDLGFSFTMNGTGRNTIGELTGEKLTGDKAQYNTTSLQIRKPPIVTLSQAAVEFGIEATLGEPVTVKPKEFGIMAKGQFMDIEGEVAFKINVDSPKDMTAFILIIDVNEVTIIDFLMMSGGLWAYMMRKTTFELMPDTWKKKVEKVLDISIKDALIYFVPVKNSIGGVIYEDTGFVIAGKLDLYGWQTKLYGVFDVKAGVALAGEMDPINLAVKGTKIFSLGRSSKSKQLTPKSLREVTINGNGARMACVLMQPGLGREEEIKVIVDARMEFLGTSIDVMMTLVNTSFQLETSLNMGVMKGSIKASFDAEDNQGRTRFLGSGDITGGVNLPTVSTPLGKINFGRISFGAGFDVDTWISSSNGFFSFTVRANFSYNSVRASFSFTIRAGFKWSELGKMIENEIRRQAPDLALKLFSSLEEWAKVVGKGVIHYSGEVAKVAKNVYREGEQAAIQAYKTLHKGANEIAKGLKNVYGKTEREVAILLKGAGYAINEVGHAIKSAYNLSAKGASIALKGAGYAVNEVGDFVKSAYGLGAKGVAIALKGAGYAVNEVGDFVKSAYGLGAKGAAIALKGAGYAVNEVGGFVKSAYGLSAKGAALALKGAGYAVNEVGGFVKSAYGLGAKGVATALKGAGYAVNEVGGFVKSAYNLGADGLNTALKGAGYAANEVEGFFKDLGGEFSNFFSSVGDALNNTFNPTRW